MKQKFKDISVNFYTLNINIDIDIDTEASDEHIYESESKLSILSLNIQSMNEKYDEFKTYHSMFISLTQLIK